MTLFAERPGAACAASARSAPAADRLARRSCGPNEVYLNAKAADELGAKRRRQRPHPRRPASRDARACARSSRYDGAATAGDGLLMPLAPAQRLLGKPGLVDGVFVANRGGVAQTDRS